MEDLDPENLLIIELATGEIRIELFADVAPLHVERIKTLAREGEYDNVAFHRVIEGFVAQAGDVQFGDLEDGYDPDRVGEGGSELDNVPAEFSDIPFERGIVGMARSGDPLAQLGFPEREEFLNSANSQFFIMLDEASFLNGRYTAFGEVVEGMDLVDGIKLGTGNNGAVEDPDRMVSVSVYADLFGLGLDVEAARQVAYLYEAALDRDGEIDLPGLNFWIDRREDGLTVFELSASFLDSPEFQARAEAFLGDGTDLDRESVRDDAVFSDEDYVQFLYENVLDRDFDQEGFEFWLGVLQIYEDTPGQGETARERLLVNFAESDENVDGAAYVETLSEVEPGEWAFA